MPDPRSVHPRKRPPLTSRRLAVAVAAVLAMAGSAVPAVAASESGSANWFVSWATAQQEAGEVLEEQTVRVIVHLSQGGRQLRVHLGNTVGTEPVVIRSATVALRADGARVDPATIRDLTFSRSRSVTVPAGARTVSDPITLTTRPGDDLAVSLYMPGPAVPSRHAEAFDTNYLTEPGSGDTTSDSTGESFTRTTTSYALVTAVDVENPDIAGSIVVVGGSVTDGTGSRKTGTMGSGPAAPPNSRWSDVLARRIVAGLPPNRQFGVANAGISGNSVSEECASVFFGAFNNVAGRFDRDVLTLSGVRAVIVYAGTNDLGNGCDANQIISGFRDLIRRAHARNIRVIIATVTPRLTYSAVQNQHRSTINAWLTRENSCGGECDGVVDFASAIGWYANPNAIDPAYDAGDTIHPNAEGYARMGETIDLRLMPGR